MYFVKVHEKSGEVIVATCDPEIIEKELSDGNLTITPRKAFYGDEKMGLEGLLEKIRSATIVNALGDKVVDSLVEASLIDEKNIIQVCGVKHAQIINMD